MSENLDKYIKDSKVIPPDSGEYRRLNRILLKKRMASGPERSNRHRILILLVVVVFILLVSGQISQHGKDSSEVGETTDPVTIAPVTGTVVKVIGISYGGKTQWIKFTRKPVQGEDITSGEPTLSPLSETPDNWDHFLASHFSGLREKASTDPPHQQFQMTADGVLLDVSAWTYEFPTYGEVTRYEGIPVE